MISAENQFLPPRVALWAAECRRLLADGINPRETRSSDIPTFGEAFAEYVKAQGPAWSNRKHAAQWDNR